MFDAVAKECPNNSSVLRLLFQTLPLLSLLTIEILCAGLEVFSQASPLNLGNEHKGDKGLLSNQRICQSMLCFLLSFKGDGNARVCMIEGHEGGSRTILQTWAKESFLLD